MVGPVVGRIHGRRKISSQAKGTTSQAVAFVASHRGAASFSAQQLVHRQSEPCSGTAIPQLECADAWTLKLGTLDCSDASLCVGSRNTAGVPLGASPGLVVAPPHPSSSSKYVERSPWIQEGLIVATSGVVGICCGCHSVAFSYKPSWHFFNLL